MYKPEKIERHQPGLGIAPIFATVGNINELGFPIAQLLQGPVADSLTHVGQIAMLRRLADSPVKGENYAKARIDTGIVVEQQKPAVHEFD